MSDDDDGRHYDNERFENNQQGRNNFFNNGHMRDNNIYFGSEPRVVGLDVRDRVRLRLPSPTTILASGAGAAILGALGTAADLVTLSVAANPFLQTVAAYLPQPFPTWLFMIGIVLFGVGGMTKGKWHLQFGAWSLCDTGNALEVSQKAAPCPICPGTMRLTTLGANDATPYFVCDQNPRHALEFDYTLRV